MRIIQVNASYKPAYIYGGPTMSVSRLSEELVKAGIKSEVYTTTADGETELKIKAGVETIVDGVPVTYFRRITKGNSHLSPALLSALWLTLKEYQKRSKSTRGTSNNVKTSSNHQTGKPSNTSIIVHIHAWWNLVSVGSCLIALLLARKVILSPRGTLSNYSFGNRSSLLKNTFHQIIGKALLRRCHFHVSSEKEKQDILNIIDPKSIKVIPNFVSLAADFDSSQTRHIAYENADLARTKYRETECFNILFLSRVEEKKGLDKLFYALQKIDSNYRLTIAGSGNHEYLSFLKSLAGNLGINDRITWIGQQRNEDKFQILSNHDLMVLPSHDESFANVVIESLSVGTPVLVSSMVGLADYILENDFGWVYTSTEKELSDALKTAFYDTEKRRLVYLNAPGKIISDFNEKQLLLQYLQLYENVLKYD